MGRAALKSALFALIAVAICSSSIVTAEQYRITDLGPLVGAMPRTTAFGINNLGVVVGQSFVNPAEFHPFDPTVSGDRPVQWVGGRPEMLWEAFTACICDPPGTPVVEFTGGQPLAINDAGFIVGRHWLVRNPLPGPGVPHGEAFLIQGSDRTTYRRLGALGGAFSVANDINHNTVVVGTAEASDRARRAFVWDAQQGMRDLGTLAGHVEAEAFAINDAGQILGRSYGSTVDSARAFLYDPISGMTDLESIIGVNVLANDVNNAGRIVGTASSSAFAWDADSGFILLPSSTTNVDFLSARAVNESGIIVGVGVNTAQQQTALVWDEANGTRALRDLVLTNQNWDFSIAFDINDVGQITGVGLLDGQVRGFALTPVPEPVSWIGFAVGLVVITIPRFTRRNRGAIRTNNL